ncbi:hypothetical protein JK202_09870 [Gluconobacter sp. Dm-62]|uniref:hypothetical protein n=1 Tax=Gluconobacter sp. Dm-62 TaxID=2799804 RepID=UPI001B8D1000|nr:hypothetical protein [Gluconobacter sp. Dm-62]MBS1103322.1 hypothetical protein [Gluconobacter sp. Dm-62]
MISKHSAPGRRNGVFFWAKALPLMLIAVDASTPLFAQTKTVESSAQVAKILARPLFAPTRLPAHGPQAATESMPILTGITRDGEALTALFRLPDQPKVFRAQKDQSFSGWKVATLSATAATLERGGQSVTLHLDFRHAPPP